MATPLETLLLEELERLRRERIELELALVHLRSENSELHAAVAGVERLAGEVADLRRTVEKMRAQIVDANGIRDLDRTFPIAGSR